MSYEVHEFHDVTSHVDLPDHVVSGLETCIASAFGGGITQDDAREHMAGQQVLVANANLDGTYVVKGFSSTTITSPAEVFGDGTLSNEKGAYFAGAAICSTAQGNGLYHDLNQRRVGFALDHGVETIFTRTQNPRVEEGITASVVRLVEEGVISTYGLSRIVCRGVYGKMLTATRPSGRRVVYDNIDYANGDANILTWRFQR
jgi:hypothetical protein